MARELGYVPDPTMARWASAAWTTRRSQKSGFEIAFISPLDNPDCSARFPTAKKRASELGYTLRFFSLSKLKTWKALNRILRARSIPGVILDKWHTDVPLELDDECLSVVSCGVGTVELPYHTVHLNTFQQMEVIWLRLHADGQRRVYLLLQESRNELQGRLHYGAALECQARLSPKIVGTEFDQYPNPQAVAMRILKSKADAVVSLISEVNKPLQDHLNMKGWKGVSYAIHTQPGCGFSGMMPHDTVVGWETVNLLDRLIRQFETGRPENPLNVLVKPQWYEAGEDPKAQLGKGAPSPVRI